MSDDHRRPGDRPPPASAASSGKSGPSCPLCGRPRVQAYRPFCSARCRDVDLARWFGETYAVPAVEPGYEGDDGDPD
jgi:endogenous inhibitor of DNA gyrase (YacG/DUF329 family)